MAVIFSGAPKMVVVLLVSPLDAASIVKLAVSHICCLVW